jgi:hypothetical protein
MSRSDTTGNAPTRELVLPLADVAHLFSVPPADPLAASPTQVLSTSGVDYLLGVLRAEPPRRPRTLALLLPADETTPELTERTTRALRRHAELRIEVEKRELRALFWSGWRVAALAILLLAICLGLSSIFTSPLTESMGPLLRKTFEYGFEITGWVILWHPIDLLVFAPMAYRSRIRALRKLGSCEVVIRQNPGST